MKYIVANWKSNKTTEESLDWLNNIKIKLSQINPKNISNLEIIVAPPVVFLPLMKKIIEENSLPIKLASQDVSPYGFGPYTGAVASFMLEGLADYAIIGHSERRKLFLEDDQILEKKVKLAVEAKLRPIYCVQDAQTYIPQKVDIVAYEPIYAIGTGQPDSPENANKVAGQVKQKKDIHILYGGSVTEANIGNYLCCSYIDGALIGGASLDADNFWEIIINASTN